jgi:hypothetical protein
MIPTAGLSGRKTPPPQTGRTEGRSAAGVPAIRRASQAPALPISSRSVLSRPCGGNPGQELSRCGPYLLGLAKARARAVKLQQAGRVDLKADRTARFGTRYVGMRTHDDRATSISKRHVDEDIRAEILDACDDTIQSSIPGRGYCNDLWTKREVRRVAMNTGRKRHAQRYPFAQETTLIFGLPIISATRRSYGSR